MVGVRLSGCSSGLYVKHLRRHALVISLALSLAACGGDSPVGVEALSLDIRLSSATFSPGDTISIAVTVTNLSGRSIKYSNSACPLTVQLVGGGSAQPATLAGGPLGCILLLVEHTLGPYESDEHTYRFVGWASTRASPLAADEWTELAPGTYQVTAEINDLDPTASAEPETLEITGP